MFKSAKQNLVFLILCSTAFHFLAILYLQDILDRSRRSKSEIKIKQQIE